MNTYLLIVDDNVVTNKKLEIYFQALGYRVKTVTWNEETFNFFGHQPIPDVIILGVSTTTLQRGCNIFHRLRNDLLTRRAAIIFLAENEEDETNARLNKIIALELGVDEYVIKPLDIEELKLRVRNKVDFAQRQRFKVSQQEEKKDKILIVEDDHDIQKMLRVYFEAMGYVTYTTVRGNDGLEIAGKFLPNLVILDIQLPDIDGYEVCRSLRLNKVTHAIPILFLTQKDERDDRIAGLELGADDYITKPFDIEELGLKVKTIIKRDMQIGLISHSSTDEFNSIVGNQVGILSIEVQISHLSRRLNKLREIKAIKGIDTEPHYLIEIDNLQEKLDELLEQKKNM